MSSIAAWFSLIMSDFASTPAADIDVRLIDFDPARSAEFSSLIPDIGSWIDPHDPSAHRLLLKVADNVSSFDELASDPIALAVAIASTLQDFVMDETGSPWPEVTVDGRRVLMEPRLAPDGAPRWEGRGVDHCSFGHLTDWIE
jgi:hypothetical protein